MQLFLIFGLFIASTYKYSWFLYVDLVSFNLAELFISSSSFCLLVFTEFSIYKIMSSVSKDSFTSSFPIWKPLIFSHLIG